MYYYTVSHMLSRSLLVPVAICYLEYGRQRVRVSTMLTGSGASRLVVRNHGATRCVRPWTGLALSDYVADSSEERVLV